jgi:threonine dehydrogenase-like Zn-dependent dehydrogenase
MDCEAVPKGTSPERERAKRANEEKEDGSRILNRARQAHPGTIRLIEEGDHEPLPLVSHIMPLADVAKGYEIFNARKGNVNVLLKP